MGLYGAATRECGRIGFRLFQHPTIWKASGHVDAFNDPLIDNKDSKKRYRADVLIEDHIAKYDDKIEKDGCQGKKEIRGKV